MKITAGIDVGSLTTDAVIVRDGKILSFRILPTGSNPSAAALSAYNESLKLAGIKMENVNSVIATGYGRDCVDFANRTVTEITCHALGARRLFPQSASVIDIGGQDCKVIRLAADGRVEDFIMNDKCAAGTGRFLEVMADALETNLESMGELSEKSKEGARITSTCTVFAESEVISLVSKGTAKEDIIRGIHEAIGERVYGMIRRVRAEAPYVITGGVAKNKGVRTALEMRLNSPLLVPDEPQIVGALGAAIAAGEW
jgi:predicted CoA-substrate-specific enzyme activase